MNPALIAGGIGVALLGAGAVRKKRASEAVAATDPGQKPPSSTPLSLLNNHAVLKLFPPPKPHQFVSPGVLQNVAAWMAMPPLPDLAAVVTKAISGGPYHQSWGLNRVADLGRQVLDGKPVSASHARHRLMMMGWDALRVGIEAKPHGVFQVLGMDEPIPVGPADLIALGQRWMMSKSGLVVGASLAAEQDRATKCQSIAWMMATSPTVEDLHGKKLFGRTWAHNYAKTAAELPKWQIWVPADQVYAHPQGAGLAPGELVVSATDSHPAPALRAYGNNPIMWGAVLANAQQAFHAIGKAWGDLYGAQGYQSRQALEELQAAYTGLAGRLAATRVTSWTWGYPVAPKINAWAIFKGLALMLVNSYFGNVPGVMSAAMDVAEAHDVDTSTGNALVDLALGAG